MVTACPFCDALASMQDIDEAADAALCRCCNQVYRLNAREPEFGVPPNGLCYEAHLRGFRAVARFRSGLLAAALGLLLFFATLLWIHHLWREFKESPQLDLEVGAALLLAVVGLAVITAILAFGRSEVTLSEGKLSIRSGIGPLSIPAALFLDEIRWARTAPTAVRLGPLGQVILLEASDPVRFGSLVPDERLHFLLRVIRTSLADR